jgi:hypothetical protein
MSSPDRIDRILTMFDMKPPSPSDVFDNDDETDNESERPPSPADEFENDDETDRESERPPSPTPSDSDSVIYIGSFSNEDENTNPNSSSSLNGFLTSLGDHTWVRPKPEEELYEDAEIEPRFLRYAPVFYIQSEVDANRKLIIKIDPMVTKSSVSFLAYNLLHRMWMCGAFNSRQPFATFHVNIPVCKTDELKLKCQLKFNPSEKADIIVGAKDIIFNNIDIDVEHNRIWVGLTKTPHYGNVHGNFLPIRKD